MVPLPHIDRLTPLRLLITGGQGFLGRHLAAMVLQDDPEATVLALGRSGRCDSTFPHDATWRGRQVPAPVPTWLVAATHSPRYHYAAVDLRDRAALDATLVAFAPNAVLHLAAALRDEPLPRLIETNIGLTLGLLEALSRAPHRPERVVLGSTGGVYGVCAGRPLREDDPCDPVDPYSASKLASEITARAFARALDLPLLWARIFNPVGAGQDERHVTSSLAARLLALDHGVLQTGPLGATRDYIDARDVASALALLLNVGTPGLAYNVGSGREVATRSMVGALVHLAGKADDVTVVESPGRPAGVPRHVADISRLEGLGWAPQFSLDDSLAEVLHYYRHDVAAATTTKTTAHARAPERIPVRVATTAAYDIEVRPGLVDELAGRLTAQFGDRQFALLTDQRVFQLHGERTLQGLHRAGLQAAPIVVPEGEPSKSADCCEFVVNHMHAMGFRRRDILVNFGGGMVTDLGGYVAATYLRGVPYVNVPTTLLAQHDSAIGGKVAINTPFAKNFIGAFHHPSLVLVDPCLLATLDSRNLAAGIAEAIKVGLCGDRDLFELLENNVAQIEGRDPALLAEVVRRAAATKVALLAKDPLERDLRRPLNLGHTLAHPLETQLGYRSLLHGEAVAFGLAVATSVARRRGVCGAEDAQRILALLHAYGLPPQVQPVDVLRCLEHFQAIRLVRDGAVHYVMPVAVDRVCIVADIDAEEIRDAALAVCALGAPQALVVAQHG